MDQTGDLGREARSDTRQRGAASRAETGCLNGAEVDCSQPGTITYDAHVEAFDGRRWEPRPCLEKSRSSQARPVSA